MRIAVGSDERTALTDFVVAELERRGHQVTLAGALRGIPTPWPEVGKSVGRAVATGQAEEGVVFCWTGTGVSIAANKVPGVRAALCTDAATARGARLWNHANVLVMSLRLTTPGVAQEMLVAWFSTPFGGGEDAANVAKLGEMEFRYSKRPGAAAGEKAGAGGREF
ncbi:MAG: RpiB/LacA/LacB family sugar-phosphate isomerase [Chloroflexi bacterium]|nr:RpiB/LacA/LacB family sugar-phosphate isomerase [Chloroflexota bacterium]